MASSLRERIFFQGCSQCKSCRKTYWEGLDVDFYGLGFLVSAVGVLPLLFARKWITTAVLCFLGTIVWGSIFYLSVPFMVWPWYGLYGFATALMLLVSSVMACCDFFLEKFTFRPFSCAIWLFLLFMVFSPISGCALFRSSDYASLIGNVETRVWTQDIQPKDPRHIRMASVENALFMARQAFGQAGSIGSQFEICEDSATPQFIDGKFKIVVPIDFRGLWQWNATGTVPGYVLVDGEDPSTSAQFIQLPEGKQFTYSPNAYFGCNLKRHLWRQGYRNYGLTSYTLEIDDQNNPWWTVTLYEPACFAWGERFAGIVLVNPVNGECTMYEPGEIPSWVDLAVPSSFVYNWVGSKGKYHSGFWNTVFGKRNIVKPEYPVMVYGSDGEPYWVTGVTSDNKKDTSLVGLYYTCTRTGKSVFYKAEGSTDQAILEAVAKNEQVQFKRLHGTVPQIYNIRGTMASVVPLLNESHMFQGVAIVNVKNVQLMGVGKDQFEALREYERILPLGGHQIAPELSRKVVSHTGVVERMVMVPKGNEPIFYLYLKDVPHIFTGGVQLSPKLPLTKVGDQVTIEYYASGQSIEPLHAFDNPAIKLEMTTHESHVQRKEGITSKK